MSMQPPPPPSITPRQMNLLRVVASMAWADGELAQEEVDVMLREFGSLFASGEQQEQIAQELRDYLMQNIPLEESIPKLQTQQERELVLALGYEVISSSSRVPDEPKINEDEAIAYQKLKQLLNLPEARVKELEAGVDAQSNDSEGLVDSISRKLGEFIREIGK